MGISPHHAEYTSAAGISRTLQVSEGIRIAPNGITAWQTDINGVIVGLTNLTLSTYLLVGPGQPAFGPTDLAIGIPYAYAIYSRNFANDGNRNLINLNKCQNEPGGTTHGNDTVFLGDTTTQSVCPGDDTTTQLGDLLFRWSQIIGCGGTAAAPAFALYATIDPFDDANYSRFDMYQDGTYFWFRTKAGGTGTQRKILISAPQVWIDGRLNESIGVTVVAANDLALGLAGNLFHISGNTQINAITTTSWQAGAEVMLIFDGTPTVKHNTAGGGGTAKLLLAGSVDFSATANDTLTLRYDGTSWFEKCRTVI